MDRPQTPGQETSSAASLSRVARRLAHVPLLRTAFGLAVLAGIVGGLVLINRSSGDDRLVDVSSAPAGVEGAQEIRLGPLSGDGPRVGKPAPDFALLGLDGEVHRLSDFRGQPVWINFWATWCPPCRKELPDIQALFDEKKDEGLVVLEVDFQESAGQAQEFWDELGLTMPVLLDSDGSVFDLYRLRGLPDSFFVDADGILRAMQPGILTEGQMRDKLAEVGLP